jgi:uncharacterized protein
MMFDDFAGFKLLKFFLFNPSDDYNINEIAEKLKISTSTTKRYCDLFLKEEIVLLKEIGNQKRFSLNNYSIYVKQLKKTYSLIDFKKKDLEKIANSPALIAIYGSFASGDYFEQSDLDLLIVGDQDDINKQQLSKFRKRIKYDLQLFECTLPKWEKMKKEKNPFAESILKNHVIIKGENL